MTAPLDPRGYPAASFTTPSVMPQAEMTLRSGDTAAISRRVYLMLTSGVVLLGIYGWLRGDGPLVVANATTLVRGRHTQPQPPSAPDTSNRLRSLALPTLNMVSAVVTRVEAERSGAGRRVPRPPLTVQSPYGPPDRSSSEPRSFWHAVPAKPTPPSPIHHQSITKRMGQRA